MRKMPSGRIFAVCFMVLGLLAALAASAGAAGPVRSTGGSLDLTLPAGVICPFPLHWAADDSHMNVATFPVQANGDQRLQQTGHASGSTLTNLDTGASMVVPESYKLTQVTHTDGTFDWYISGNVVLGGTPADVGGPYLRLYRGNLHVTLDAQGNAVASTFKGTYQDLCAALSS